MSLANPHQLIRQNLTKLIMLTFQTFVSLKVLGKHCAQYSKMAIVFFAYGDASMWPGNRPKLINHVKKISNKKFQIFFPHPNPIRHVELFTYCWTLQQLWEHESEISWQDYVKHRWRVAQERSLIFNSDPSEIALEVFIHLSVPDEAWTCLDWDPDPT